MSLSLTGLLQSRVSNVQKITTIQFFFSHFRPNIFILFFLSLFLFYYHVLSDVIFEVKNGPAHAGLFLCNYLFFSNGV